MTLHRLNLAVVIASFVLALGGQALAQTPLDDPLDDHSAKRLDRMEKVVRELRAIVFQGRETGQPVVVQPADTEGQLNRLSDRVNALEQSLARLNGQLEIATHELDQSRGEATAGRGENTALKDRLSALEQKLAALSAASSPAPAEPAAQAAAPTDPAEAFAAARRALFAGDYVTAEAGFRGYLEGFGDGPNGPMARYYLAKTLIARGAWADAATSDIDAIRGWPQTAWASQAVLDLSRALVSMNKPADACQTLDELNRRYPKAPRDVIDGASKVRAQAQCR